MELSFYGDVYSIEGMVGEKMTSFSFGGAVGPGLQTPSAGTGKPWVLARQVGLQAIIYRHMALGLPWALRPDPHVWLQTQASGFEDQLGKALALGLVSRPILLGSCVRTQVSWVLC